MDHPAHHHAPAGQHKQIMYGAIGLVALYLLYRWYASRSAAAAATTTAGSLAPDTSGTGADYASLSGQEQSDVAALQQQNQGLAAQEQSDVAGLNAGLGANAAQESSDVTGLQGQLGALTDTINGLVDSVSGSSTAQGPQQAHKHDGKHPPRTEYGGGLHSHAFDRYYRQVTGHAPPAHIHAGNSIYDEYKRRMGVGRARRQNAAVSHEPKPHMPTAGKAGSRAAAGRTGTVHHPTPVVKPPPPKPPVKPPTHSQRHTRRR